jgi:hypothetical protein
MKQLEIVLNIRGKVTNQLAETLGGPNKKASITEGKGSYPIL